MRDTAREWGAMSMTMIIRVKCGCGCGEKVTPGRDFLPGHDHIRTLQEHREMRGLLDEVIQHSHYVPGVLVDLIKMQLARTRKL